MADATTALTNLRAAILAAIAADGSFPLTAAFLANGMNDPSVAVPQGFDATLATAFCVAADSFTVTATAAGVGPLAGGQFTVAGATIPLVGGTMEDSAPVTTPADLLFASTSDGDGNALLVVQVASKPDGWNWETSFPSMTGWPFDQVPLTAATLYFSTAAGTYPWGNAAGIAVTDGATQTLSAKTDFPSAASPYLGLFAGLVAPGGSMSFSGSLDMTSYGGPSFDSGALYPTGTVAALLSDASFTFASYLTAAKPSLAIIFQSQPPTPDEGEGEGDAGDEDGAGDAGEDETPEVVPSLALTADLSVPGGTVGDYQVRATIFPTSGSGSTSYGVYLVPLTNRLLTPAAAISLAAGTGSYFDGTPAVLQQFLTSFGLTGFTIIGAISNNLPSVGQLSILLSTPPGEDIGWQPLPNPTGNPEFSFTIDSFALNWSVNTPFSAPSFSYLFSTSFTILPSVFKSADGKSAGTFDVQFGSDLVFRGSFAGTASLTDFLNVVSAGAVVLPSSVSVTLSDITLDVDYTGQSFAFTSGLTADLSFLTVGGYPVFSIREGSSVSLAAIGSTDGSGTAWSGQFAGTVGLCGLIANVSVDYESQGERAGWALSASLAEPVDVGAVIEQFLSFNGTYDFPSFLVPDLEVTALDAACFLPSDTTKPTTYQVSTGFDWSFSFGDQAVEISNANIALAYDGETSSGSASATWIYDAINLSLDFSYAFVGKGNTTLAVTWQGFTATYQSSDDGDKPQQSITFTMKGWSLGTLISGLMTTLGDPYFTLPSPWDLLNQISLDGLSITVSLTDGDTNRLTGSYTLSSPLNLGFIVVKGLSVTRNTKGEVRLSLDADVSPLLQDSLGTLTEPEGQSVTDMPSVPGQGSEYFKLNLMALGQKVGIAGYSGFETTQAAIAALRDVPPTDGPQNPVVPTSTAVGSPYYNASSNWLIALDFDVMKTGSDWLLSLQLVFNDPDLYGLHIAFNGDKAGPLKGFDLDIIYKKISDDVGLFQTNFTFPDSIRNLNFGAVSVVLPSIGVQIYTNGDFLIDLGFPYNMDFTRSFSLSAIVFGVPVLGSGGLYFGKVPAAAAAHLPTTSQGSFNPVITIGLGMQLGLGYNFTAGPLSAGFALTAFGIVEGVFATFHPYQPQGTDLSQPLQNTNYFYLSGTVGLIGMLYGTVDFSIITASVMVNITLSASITYQSFEPILINASASVRASVRVKINLGLFSIRISLSFHTEASVSFVINLPGQGKAPWLDSGARANSLLLAGSGTAAQGHRHWRRSGWNRRALPREALRNGNGPLFARSAAPVPRPARLNTAGAASKPTLTLVVAPQFTVLAPPEATSYAQQQGAFVCMFAMDAPDPTAAADNTPDAQSTSFEMLCASFLPWLVDLMAGETAAVIDLAAVSAQTVSLDQLQDDLNRIAESGGAPFTTADLLTFLSDAFTLNIVYEAPADGTNHILFPLFDGLTLTIPDPSGGDGSKTIDLETYASATAAYCQTVAKQLRQAAAGSAAAPPAVPAARDGESQSVASFIFTDVFTIVARALLQAGVNAFGNYACPVGAGDSIDSLLTGLNASGNTLTSDDIAVPNADYPLRAGLALTLTGLATTIQAGDTLTAIAARYSSPSGQEAGKATWLTSPAGLVTANPDARILQPGVALSLTVNGTPTPYLTRPGDSFRSIADSLGIGLDDLSQQTSLYSQTGLLIPALTIALPDIAYRTVAGDTLAGIAATFATTAAVVGFDNAAVAGLFGDGHIAVANLDALPLSQLWDSITATSEIAQAAGQVANFLASGLRLPVATGLTLSDDFLYPATQTDYALFQLSGQQFPTPAQATGYTVSLSRADQSHGVDLSFITFAGAAGSTSIAVDLSQAYGYLETVLAYAQAGKFTPAPTLADLPLVQLQPRQFATAGFARWSTADYAALAAVTGNDGQGATAQPYLWSLSQSLLNKVQNRQAALTRLIDPAGTNSKALYSRILQLMPAYRPRRGTTSPNDPATVFTDLTRYAFATRVDFKISRLSASAAAGLSGAADASTAAANDATIYQLIGPSSGDAQMLENLLTAMAALGDELVSGLFLLYSGGSGDAATLTGQADTDFLSFITQTNLSTEGAPPPAAVMLALRDEAPTPPRGIANKPAAFISLLWEQSVVRGGGYYLYWEQPASGAGLPAEIFGTDGTATLTMVATLAPGMAAGAGNALANYVNAFLTTDNIDPVNDVVVVQSQSTQAASLPLAGTESLADLAALYGCGVGALGQANEGAVMATGALVPVSGILHQLTAADTADPGQTLTALAAYYSAGAVTALTAGDISAYNPGVGVATGATFAIPPVTYKVNPAPKPGGSLQSLSNYYGLPVASLAVLAADVAGLYPAGATLNVDMIDQDTQATQPPGNLGFTLSRANLGTPDAPPAGASQQQLDDFAEQTLSSLYNTLSAGLAANPYFAASPFGLPFTPQDDGTGQPDEAARTAAEPAAATADGHRPSPRSAARARSASLAALADQDLYQYSQVLGFTGSNSQGQPFAKINAAPASPAAGLPAAANNPYAGIGTYASTSLRWQDLYGNVTLTPFELVPAGYAGALNDAPTALRYTDRLIGLSAWPKAQATYLYAGAAGAPVLTVNFSLDISPYDADGQAVEMAKQDLATYETLYFQLNQDYTGLGVPGVTGNAVGMVLSNSLQAAPGQPLNAAQAQQLRDFVADCYLFLANYVENRSIGSQPKASLTLPVSIGGLVADDLIRLDVSLTLTRQTALVDPLIAGLPDGLSVNSPILPFADAGSDGTASNYGSFADALETCLQTDDWFMRTGSGLSPVTAGAPVQTDQLYAVRFGRSDGKGVYVQLGSDAGYYAPLPVAKSLKSGKATLEIYSTGGGTSQRISQFSSVDLNLWFESCLAAVDKFLSATYAPPTFILDSMQASGDGALDAILSAKKTLADAISGTTTAILSSSPTDGDTLAAARNAMKQQLLTTLAPAFSAGTVTVFDVTAVSGGAAAGSGGPPSLYGQPVGKATQADGLAADDRNQNFTLTPASIPLSATAAGAPRLAFTVTSKNVDAQSYIGLDLSYQVTHMQFDKTTVPGIQDYVESQWLAFINPLTPDDLGTQYVPVLNRALPIPPTVQQQSGTGTNALQPTTGLTPAQLATWDYAFTYSYAAAAQDDVSITITLNAAGQGSNASVRDDTSPLFTALADFITNYPAISADLDLYLVQITGGTQDETVIANAAAAVAAFQTRVSAVAQAYADQFGANLARLAAVAPATIPVSFDAKLEADKDGQALVVLRNVTIGGVAASYDAVTGSIGGGGVTLAAPVMDILPDRYRATPVNPPPTGAVLAYAYPAIQKSGAPLDFTQALAESERTVRLPDLNIIVYQNAQAALLTQRNTILTPDDQAVSVTTNTDFLYQTPLVSFSTPFLPRLAWKRYALRQADAPAGSDVTATMSAFFQSLFSGASGTLLLGMGGGYSYSVAPGVAGLPRTNLPVKLLQPVAVAVDPATPPSAALALTQAVADWVAATQPTNSGDAAMDFSLSLFSDINGEQLLFVIDDLYFTTGNGG